MQKSNSFLKKSDMILGVCALMLVGALCAKGSYSLYYDDLKSQTKFAAKAH